MGEVEEEPSEKEHRSKTLHIHAVDYDGNFGIQHSVQDCILGISAL